MTEQITRPTEREDDFLSELPIAPTRIQSEIDRLTFATEAMRLASAPSIRTRTAPGAVGPACCWRRCSIGSPSRCPMPSRPCS